MSNHKNVFLAISSTLTARTLSRLALGGAVILLLTSAVSTWVLYRQVEDHARERLALQALERARVAERVLAQTVESHEVVRRAFVERWPQYQGVDTLRRFDKLFVMYPDGAIRNRPEISDGRKWSTGWIRKGEVVSDDLKRRFVLFFDLSQQYGPGMVVRAENLFFTGYPEQANMGYDPILSPDWILTIPAEYDQRDYEWGRTAYQATPVGGPSQWHAAELDLAGGQTVHTAGVSSYIHYQGRQLAAVNSGTGLPDLMAKIYGNGQPASLGRMVLLRDDGRLIHDPEAAEEFKKAMPRASLPLHHAILAKNRQVSRYPFVEYDQQDDSYFAVARIEGPNWLVAMVLPGQAVRSEALGQAQWALWVGLVALILLLSVFASVLRRRIAQPLGELTRAAERVAGGEADVRLPAGRPDELGRLAQA
ncbi:MAG: HAMP domain-containing protein, partial [Pseudomonadota bacterium]